MANRQTRRAIEKKAKKLEKQELKDLTKKVKDAQARFLKTGKTDYQDASAKQVLPTWVQQEGRQCPKCQSVLSTSTHKDEVEVIFCRKCIDDKDGMREFLETYYDEIVAEHNKDKGN